MAKVYDKILNYDEPQLEDVVLKTHVLSTGVFTISINKYRIDFSKEEKEDLIKEWDLMESLNKEWKVKNIDNQEEYFKFLDEAHNAK